MLAADPILDEVRGSPAGALIADMTSAFSASSQILPSIEYESADRENRHLSIYPASAGIALPAQAQPVQGGVNALEIKWSKAPCRFCGTGCGVMVGVKEGRVVATHGEARDAHRRTLFVRRRRHHPRSPGHAATLHDGARHVADHHRS